MSGDRDMTSTFSGNRGLDIKEDLLFEIGSFGDGESSDTLCGVDISLPDEVENRLGSMERSSAIGLPGLSEPRIFRHFVRLSRMNYAIDMGFFPLGSCTMKHNPRLNEHVARFSGFSDIHPLQSGSSVQGALELIYHLSEWLKILTGMPCVAMSPKAGAHGELCGMMTIRAALEASGGRRSVVLAPESAHGTNPATAAMLGYEVRTVPTGSDGRVSVDDVRPLLGPEVAAIMLTNPNTCGLFEGDICEIADALHSIGGYFYCDGANFNALVGRVRPGDLGIDAMHINLHKTFSTPHGGGGPGAGPVVLSDRLAPFAPFPWVERDDKGFFRLVESADDVGNGISPFGRLTAFHGQMGMFTRALSYILSHGGDGLRQASEDAVLNANYVRVRLRDHLNQPFGDHICMHEVLFDDSALNGTGISTLDLAKGLIDEGYHPMTVYFPLVASGAMLIEPTESETRLTLDEFTSSMISLIEAAKGGDIDRFKHAPYFAPTRRLDETRAARKPKLRWRGGDE